MTLREKIEAEIRARVADELRKLEAATCPAHGVSLAHARRAYGCDCTACRRAAELSENAERIVRERTRERVGELGRNALREADAHWQAIAPPEAHAESGYRRHVEQHLRQVSFGDDAVAELLEGPRISEGTPDRKPSWLNAYTAKQT